jgi:hypothetical protein
MLIISIIVCFSVCFVAGMNYAVWDEHGELKNLYLCMALSVIGIWNLISLIGLASRVQQ